LVGHFSMRLVPYVEVVITGAYATDDKTPDQAVFNNVSTCHASAVAKATPGVAIEYRSFSHTSRPLLVALTVLQQFEVTE